MTKFYAVANQKGGVGKTTSVINLAAVIGTYGLRTLVVDLDPQANATSGLGYNKHEFDRSTYDLLLEQVEVEGLLIRNAEFGLDILPANPALAGAEIELVNLAGREYRLQQALSAIDGQYDYVL
ncbi:MAG: AAA family ATPase, partial [Anaerolineaceae bacterium]